MVDHNRVDNPTDRAARREDAERSRSSPAEPVRNGRGGGDEGDSGCEAAGDSLAEEDLPVLCCGGEAEHAAKTGVSKVGEDAN